MKNIILILFFLVSSAIGLYAQDDATLNNFYDAEYAFSEGDFIGALPLFEKVLKRTPDNAYIQYKIGICLLNIETKKRKATSFLIKASLNTAEKIKEGTIKETHAPYDVHYFLGKSYMIENQIDSAISEFQIYKSLLKPKDYEQNDFIDNAIQTCQIARDRIKSQLKVNASKLPSIINKDSVNERAVISADGTAMAYISLGYKKNKIMYTTKTEDKWSNPKDISAEIALSRGATISSLSADGKRLYMIVSDFYSSDIFLSNFEKGHWGRAKALPKPINTSFIENHASESPDGNTLFFTREEFDNATNFDIFISKKKADGSWGKPVNAGTNVNTPLAEGTPFMSPDGSALYFSSEGHNSMGGYDVFYCKYNSDGTFGEAVNMGFPINTTDDDLFFVPVAENQAFYCLRNKNNDKQSFISNVTYSNEIVPRTFLVKGNIHLATDSTALSNVKVTLLDANGTPIEDLNLTENGDIEKNLTAGSYQVSITAFGYETFVKSLLLDENQYTNEYVFDAWLAQRITPVEETNFLANKNDSSLKLQNVEKLVASNEQQTISGNTEENQAKMNSFSDSGSEHPTPQYIYSIQLGAFRYQPRNNYFAKAGEIFSHKENDGLTRYNFGQFSKKSSALLELKRLVLLGYEDAFIVKVAQSENLVSFESTAQHDNAQNGSYTIQVMASVVPVKIEQFSQLSDVRESIGNDGMYRYTIGEYNSTNEALLKLEEIRNSGYKDAFLKRIKN